MNQKIDKNRLPAWWWRMDTAGGEGDDDDIDG